MIRVLIFTVFAAVICAGCHYLRFMEKKTLFCVSYAAALFILYATGLTDTEFISAQRLISLSQTESLALPAGQACLIKILSPAISDTRGIFLFLALLRAAVSALFIRYECSEPYTPAAILTVCFTLDSVTGTSVCIAALICAWSLRYLLCRRFFRFFSLILLAMCFDKSAALMLLVYIVSFIPNVFISAAVLGVFALVPLIVPQAAEIFFSYLPGEVCTGARFSPFRTVLLLCFSLLFLIAHSMFLKRDEKFDRLTPLFFAGAVFSFTGLFDPRFYPISLMLSMPCALILAPEARSIGRSFLNIVFPDKKKTVPMRALIFIYIVCFSFYIFELTNASFVFDVNGAAFFGA